MESDKETYADFDYRLDEIAAATRYRRDALLLAWQAVAPQELRLVGNHTSAQEACWRFRDLAILKFGSSAHSQLRHLGVSNCEDIGQLILLLVDAGLVQRSETDDVENQVRGVYDFSTEFHFKAKPRRPQRRLQWRLSTIFIITTVAAIGAAGSAKLGIHGSLAALFATWIGLVGACCLWLGITDRSKGWGMSVAAGCLLLAASIVAFFAVVMR